MKIFPKSILTFLLISFAFAGFAQETVVQPQHDKKVYVDRENARLYVWKTGLYLYIGTENDERAFKYQLLNRESAGSQEVSPFYLDLEGLNTIIEPSLRNRRIGKDKLSEFQIFADWSAPKTKVSESVKKMVRVESREIRGTAFDINLNSDDNVKKGSGVDQVFYSLNDGEYIAYEDTPVSIVDEGLYTFRYYAVDNVGNVEKAHTKYYGLDLTAPVTEHRVLSGNINDILSPRAVLNLIAEDEMAGVSKTYYNLDGAKNSVYKKNISLKKVSEGEHVLYYNSIDRIDNEEEVKEYAFYLDRTPPVSSLSVDQDLYEIDGKSYVSGRSKITINAQDAKVSLKDIYYTENGGSVQIFNQPFGLTTSRVNHEIAYWADDALLNISKPVKQKYILDIAAPTIFHEFDGPHFLARNINYVSPTTNITFQAADKLTDIKSVEYSVNQAEFQDGSAGFNISQPGQYEVAYKATDNVNNVSPVKTTTVFVDNVAPQFDFEFGVKDVEGKTVKIANSEGNNTFPEKVFLYLYGRDDHSGMKSIRYSINGGPEQVYSSAIVFADPADYTIDVKIYDNVDNITESMVSFSITAK